MKRYRYYSIMDNGISTVLGKVMDVMDRNEVLNIETRLFKLIRQSENEYAAIIEEVRQ